MTTYSDTYAGSGVLGATEVGGIPWEVITGTWSRNGSATTATARASNPIAVLPTSSSDVDVTANVSPTGGDAVYLRVQNATNWVRVLVERHQASYYTNGYYYNNGTYTLSDWGPMSYAGAYSLGDDAYPPGHHYYDYNSNVSAYLQHVYTNSIHEGNVQYRTVTANQTYVAGYWTYYDVPQVFLEKCVNGTVTRVATYSKACSLLRAVAAGTSITVYIDGAAQAVATDASPTSAVKHGIGRGDPGGYDGSAIDNFSLTTSFVAFVGWGVPM